MSTSQAFRYWDTSISYPAYISLFEQKVKVDIESLSEKEKEKHKYYVLNWARSNRVGKVYTPSESAKNCLNTLQEKQLWIVITEGWCGDSSQILPVLASLANHSESKIELRICSRDTYPELLDQYKTNGSMSIPKCIAMNQKGEELFTWGPRPNSAAELFASLKSQEMEKQQIYEAVQLWYAKDKGQSVEQEIVSLLK